MKKLKLFVMSLCAMFVAVVGVRAAEPVECTENHEAKIGDICYATFKDALDAVQNNETIVLEKDAEMRSISSDSDFIPINKAITIDFNNNTLTISGDRFGAGLQVSSNVTFKNGKIVSAVEPTYEGGASRDAFAIYIDGSSNVTLTNMEVESLHRSAISFYGTTNTLTIDANSIVKTSTGAGVVAYGNGTYTLNVDGTIINSGTYSAINGAYSSTGTLNVNIGKTGKVSSTNGAAILQMAEGTVTIEGTVEGYEAGVAMTKGDVVVKDGASVSAIGHGTETEFKPSSNGKVYANGAAIYAEPVGDVTIDVKGGNITSKEGYAISAPASTEANQNLEISIEDGIFESAKGGIELNDAEDFGREAFISDGAVFLKNGKPDDSVLEYTEDLEISENGVIGTVSKIELGEAENGTVEFPKNAAKGEDVEVTITPDEGYEIAEMTVLDENGEELPFETTETGLIFTMPEGAVTISVKFTEVVLEPEKADTTELEKTIAEAEKYLDDKKYDAKEVEALKKIIEEAKGLIGADKEGQETVDAMVEVLKDAMTKVANTGDNIMSVVATGIASLAVIAGGIVLVRKNKFNN